MKNIFLKTIEKIQATDAGIGVSLIRILLGVIFLKSGAGKLFGLFDGVGVGGTISSFRDLSIPYPEFSAYLVGITELLGGLVLFAGFLTRLVSLPIGVIMIVAILTAHREGGYQYPLLILFTCILLTEVGAGILSVDKWWGERQNRPEK